MSIITYDGITIAADRRGVHYGAMRTVLKLFKVRGHAVGFVGVEDVGLLLVDWFKSGANVEQWPEKAQDDEDNSSILIVANSHGIGFYCQYPVLCPIHDPFWAWGCGRNFALGAMEMGADAVRAAEVACRFDPYCGGEIVSYKLEDLAGGGETDNQREETINE